jgi:hypothetical protein
MQGWQFSAAKAAWNLTLLFVSLSLVILNPYAYPSLSSTSCKI